MATVGDLAAFSIEQAAALSVCEARRAALVDTVDAHNALIAQAAEQAKGRGFNLFGWRP